MSFAYGNPKQHELATRRDLKLKVAKFVHSTIQSVEIYDYFEGHDGIEVTQISDLQFQIAMKPIEGGMRRRFIVQVKESTT